ncbi:hypothetical protein WICPIJ_000492 [Wickerhamomyces pijperi]|uniref:Cyclin C-terminal domain-containing protein n=1 Tax=Wickerhamomyces pijperi TaxID=599730 RepID=A0A9P8QCF5_WICPI|nr:hypothetical protein WICPIJ_000492 [Wickerhamomyces pijperi]
MNRQIEQLSRYFLELTLYERNFIQFPNSLTAITCHLLASNLLSSTSAIDSFETSITQFYEQQQQELSHYDGEDCIVNDENQDPMSNVIAPFFSGWNEDESIESIFKILILLVFQLVNIDEVSHVLPDKYIEFQPLLHSFVNDNKVLLSYVDVHSSQLDNSSAFKLNHAQSQACQRLIGLPTDDDDDDEEEDHMQYQDNCEVLQSYDLYSNYPSAEFSRPKMGSNSNSLPLTPASAHSAVFSDAPTYTSSFSSSPTIPQYPSQPQTSNKSIFFQQSNNLIPTPVEPTFKNPNHHLPQTGTFIKQMQHQQQQQQLSDVSANEESDYDEEMPNSSPLASKSRQSAYQSGRMTSDF